MNFLVCINRLIGKKPTNKQSAEKFTTKKKSKKFRTKKIKINKVFVCMRVRVIKPTEKKITLNSSIIIIELSLQLLRVRESVCVC